MLDQNKLSITERITAPTPKLFAIIRNIGIVLATVSGAVVAMQSQGIQLPEVVTLLSEKALWISGLIAALVSQLTVDFKALNIKNGLASVGNLVQKKS
jgi:hypothetical protein